MMYFRGIKKVWGGWGPLRALIILTVSVGLFACSKSPTQLLVVVDSDLGIPESLAEVQASVYSENGRLLAASSFDLVANRAEQTATNFALPLSFGVLPPDDDASSRITVDVSALGTSTTGDSKVLFTRQAITGFVEGKSLILPMYLAGQCQFLQCPAGQTCTEKGCANATINETRLEESKGDSSDTVIRVPISDAGVNMAVDAGEIIKDADVNADAAVAFDGGMNDPGITATSTCASLKFDGVDDYIMVPDSSDWAFGTGDLTLLAWVRVDQQSENEKLGILQQFQDTDHMWSFYIAEQKLYFGIKYGSWEEVEVPWQPTFSVWHHVAVSRDAGTIRFYVDGALLGARTGPQGAINFRDISGNLSIGRLRTSQFDSSLTGEIDSVSIWQSALTADEIRSFMIRAPRGSEPSLIAAWNFDEQSDVVVVDSSDNGHEGTITGAMWTNNCPENPTGLDWVYSRSAEIEFTQSEVTVEQFEQCVISGACDAANFDDHQTPNCNYGGDTNDNDHPMNCVNWHAATEFCSWIAGRLPTEAEWQAEASDEGQRTYPWGDSPTPSCSHAMMKDPNSGVNGCGTNSTASVCSRPLGNSVSGLCDMAGNTFEWTSTLSSMDRKMCGGSWGTERLPELRADSCISQPIDNKGAGNGFRCARINPNMLGLSDKTAAPSCQAIKTARPNAPDGTYWIDPEGAGGTAAFEAYCDMTTDGGGWTLVITASLVDNAVQLVNNRSDIIAGTYLTGTQGGLSDDFDLVSPALYQVSGQELMVQEGNHIGYWKTDSGCLENQPLGAWFAMDFVNGNYRKACDKILGSGPNDMWSTYDLRNNWGGHSDKIVIMNNERDERDNYSFIGHRIQNPSFGTLNKNLQPNTGNEEGEVGLIVTEQSYSSSNNSRDFGSCGQDMFSGCLAIGDSMLMTAQGNVPPAIHYFVR